MRLLVAAGDGRQRRAGRRMRRARVGARRLPRRRCRGRPGLRRPRPHPAERSRHRPGDRRATWTRTRCTAPGELRRRIGERCAARLQHLRDEPARRPAPTAPMRPAPAGAPCATPRSTSSPPPIGRSASGWPCEQFERRHQHDGPPRRARRPHHDPGRCPRGRACAASPRATRDEPLVLDKWFALQATIPEPGTLDRVRR